MSRFYDKEQLKSQIELEGVFDLLELWGAEPEYINTGIVSQTICHNRPGEGSRKLYFYSNTLLFHCYTGCGDSSFDIFDLCIKVMKLQKNLDFELYDAMSYIASYFGFESASKQEEKELEDWKILNRHQIHRQVQFNKPQLQEYNPIILTRFSYPRILSWEKEGIKPVVYRKHLIGFCPSTEQITIPHFDINNKLVGIRGRFLAEDAAARYGKYLPLKIGSTQYSHPLSMNLYGANTNKKTISYTHTAIVFESEKSVLQFSSYYGEENNIAVACCGSSLSRYQVDLLRQMGAKELILAFDRDFEELNDEVFKRLKNKLIQLNKRYSSLIKISCIWDKDMITKCKASPIDEGPEKFEYLLKNRIFF